MKKVILVLLVAMMVMAVAAPIKLVRLRVINKSGYPIKVQLAGKEFHQPYYLSIDKGTRAYPQENVYTIIPDKYNTKVYFESEGGLKLCVSEVVPVYFNDWEAEKVVYDFRRNSKLVVTECGYPPPNLGDHMVNMYKWMWTEMYVIR